ncbi:MAG: DUF2975 domain-containing protein [Clostridia bacterium]|nr:DUF2975 domain-containing protein [Clostridia bacterium]
MELSIKKKVNRIGVAGQVVSIILIVLMAVACFALAVSAVVLAILPNDAVTLGVATDMDITVGNSLIGAVRDQIPDDPTAMDAMMKVNGVEFVDMQMEKTAEGLVVHAVSDRMQFSLHNAVYAILAGLVYCAALLVVFIFLKRLADGFRRCDTPFADDVVKRMTVFAWVLVGGAVVTSVAEAAANAVMQRSLDLSFALNPAGMDTGFELSFSFAPILIALIVLFLTIIFRYGAQLQKEADETL